ncbi:MAG: hypothetical protein ACLP07_03535 [Terracidiphilus sp.]
MLDEASEPYSLAPSPDLIEFAVLWELTDLFQTVKQDTGFLLGNSARESDCFVLRLKLDSARVWISVRSERPDFSGRQVPKISNIKGGKPARVPFETQNLALNLHFVLIDRNDGPARETPQNPGSHETDSNTDYHGA